VAGALLDLNSTAKGGLLLSNVNIVDLELIPDADPNVFPGVDPADLDENWDLRGAVVYNTNPATGVGLYVWTGRYWMPVAENEPTDQILFTVRTTDGNYTVPTSGRVGGHSHTYDWNISVDGGTVMHYNGSGSGITLSSLSSGEHQIRITPYGNQDPGWGNAYGRAQYSSSEDTELISIDAPLSTLAFAPKITETDAATNASYMFAYLFYKCPNLTAPAVIINNYRLPDTVTDLSYFLSETCWACTGLTAPLNLASLSNWLHGNNSIQNLSHFFFGTYVECTGLTVPQDLTPLQGWFNGNGSIQNLSHFFSGTCSHCAGIKNPTDFTPLSGWFDDNTSIGALTYFLYATHDRNSSLKLSGQVIFPNWIKTLTDSSNTPVRNVDFTFAVMFACIPDQGGDTGEPKFQDGTVLSSLGAKVYPCLTYKGRTGITPASTGWQ
jgi:hypothetical protein